MDNDGLDVIESALEDAVDATQVFTHAEALDLWRVHRAELVATRSSILKAAAKRAVDVLEPAEDESVGARITVSALRKAIISPTTKGGQAEDLWINIHDKLPEEYLSVLVCNANGVSQDERDPQIGYYEYESKKWFWVDPTNFDHFSQLNPTHWMPMPSTPELNKEKEPHASWNAALSTAVEGAKILNRRDYSESAKLMLLAEIEQIWENGPDPAEQENAEPKRDNVTWHAKAAPQ